MANVRSENSYRCINGIKFLQDEIGNKYSMKKNQIKKKSNAKKIYIFQPGSKKKNT